MHDKFLNLIEIGIGSYTFPWAMGVPGYEVKHPMTAFDLIEKASELYAFVVQLADNVPLDSFSKKELADLLRLAKKRSIALEVGARGMTAERLEKYIHIASSLKSKILRFVIDGPDYQPTNDEVVAVIDALLPLLEKTKIKLALENHDRLRCNDLVHYMFSYLSPYLGICLDTVNSLGVPEGPKDVYHRLARFTINLHIKDYTITRLDHNMGFKVEGTPAGQGKLNISGLLFMLNRIGLCDTAILELWTPFGPTIEETIERENSWAIESMKYLQQF